jgi:hypothetical protein
MITALLVRSGMMGNYHVPFWRAVKGATPSLTLILSPHTLSLPASLRPLNPFLNQ